MKVTTNKDNFEFQVDSKDLPIVIRHFQKFTNRDLEIRNLPVPKNPFWLFIIINIIRFYQNKLSYRMGNRCVFDPSCSHYSELAFRKKGFINGTRLTISRLKRCKPQNGGVDELT